MAARLQFRSTPLKILESGCERNQRCDRVEGNGDGNDNASSGSRQLLQAHTSMYQVIGNGMVERLLGRKSFGAE